MELAGKLLKGAIHIKSSLSRPRQDMFRAQAETLRKLLKTAAKTAFGITHNFDRLLKASNVVEAYMKAVPFSDYNAIYNKWWIRAFNGEPNICWPGMVKYFALSSGTSGASSKQIPITRAMMQSIRKAGFRHFSTLKDHNLPSGFYQKNILMLGGSTNLSQVGSIYQGDLTGILTGNLPYWINFFYRPGKQIAGERDWNAKLERIATEAPRWDIGIVAGVPAWVQILIEKIMENHQISSIHEIWPNFKVYVHGGVSFEPYRNSFQKLLGDKMIYLETYLASEGFIAFEKLAGNMAMSLVMSNGIFYEFIPFDGQNFSPDGDLTPGAEAVPLSRVEQGKDYAIILSTCAGAWRYLIGDTVRFTNIEKQEMVITGRTQHYISMCGEHLSIHNMNAAISRIDKEFNINTREFTMAGIPHEGMFAHKWWIGAEQTCDKIQLTTRLDEVLKELNDDYRTERLAAIREVLVEILPNEVFHKWMKEKGKLGGQHKFPRVLKSQALSDWEDFVKREIQ